MGVVYRAKVAINKIGCSVKKRWHSYPSNTPTSTPTPTGTPRVSVSSSPTSTPTPTGTPSITPSPSSSPAPTPTPRPPKKRRKTWWEILFDWLFGSKKK